MAFGRRAKVQINFAELTAFSVSLTAKPVAIEDGKLVPTQAKKLLYLGAPLPSVASGCQHCYGTRFGHIGCPRRRRNRKTRGGTNVFPRDAGIGAPRRPSPWGQYRLSHRRQQRSRCGAWWFFTLPPDETNHEGNTTKICRAFIRRHGRDFFILVGRCLSVASEYRAEWLHQLQFR